MTAGLRDLTTEDVIGLSVWSRSRGFDGVDECGEQLEPVGGVVVAVGADPDGERVFSTVDFRHGKPLVRDVPESDVGVTAPFNSALVKGLVARLNAETAKRLGKRGPMTAETAALITAAYRLTVVLMGGRR